MKLVWQQEHFCHPTILERTSLMANQAALMSKLQFPNRQCNSHTRSSIAGVMAFPSLPST
jgi:hypothetical protein